MSMALLTHCLLFRFANGGRYELTSIAKIYKSSFKPRHYSGNGRPLFTRRPGVVHRHNHTMRVRRGGARRLSNDR